MKALSVRQPWASLIVNSRKTIELRTWKVSYRGDILICASNKPCSDLPVGVSICIANLSDIRPATKADSIAACCDVSKNEFAWILNNIRPVEHFRIKGRLHLFDVEFPPLAEKPIYVDVQNTFQWLV